MTGGRCGRCRALLDDASWIALPLVQRIESRDSGELMTSWPFEPGSAIEARRCHCGAEASRRVRVSGKARDERH